MPQEEPALAATAAAPGAVAMAAAAADSTAHNGILVIAPRQGAKRGSRQFKAVDSITSNLSNSGQNGLGGSAGSASGGLGASGGRSGTAAAGQPGATNVMPGLGLGGGLDLFIGGNVTLSNTNVTGNHASTGDNDVSGTFHS